MTIGFSNGNYHRTFSEPSDMFSERYLNLYKAQGKAEAIELHCINEETVEYLMCTKNLDLSAFSFISLHTPHFPYQDNDMTHTFLSKLLILKEKYNMKNFVFHTDKFIDWNIFNKYKDLPISIENMDNEKQQGKTLEDIKDILDKYDFKLTLDLQHAFTNDHSMQLALDFQKIFEGKIAEYHLSAFDKEFIHYPLFKTQQDFIIHSLKNRELPVIIESTFSKIGEHETEIEYILEKFS